MDESKLAMARRDIALISQSRRLAEELAMLLPGPLALHLLHIFGENPNLHAHVMHELDLLEERNHHSHAQSSAFTTGASPASQAPAGAFNTQIASA